MLGQVLGRVLLGQPCAVQQLSLQQGQVGLVIHSIIRVRSVGKYSRLAHALSKEVQSELTVASQRVLGLRGSGMVRLGLVGFEAKIFRLGHKQPLYYPIILFLVVF